MSKPVLDLSQHADEAFYAFIGRVSLLLVEHNVDAITATMFLRELVEAGGSTLHVEQAMAIAQNYVECATAVNAYAHGTSSRYRDERNWQWGDKDCNVSRTTRSLTSIHLKAP